MDRGARWAIVHGIAKSRTWLSTWACVHTHTHTHTDKNGTMSGNCYRVQTHTTDHTTGQWLRDELLGQRTVTALGKPADWEDGGLMSQRPSHLSQKLGFLSTKRGGSQVKHFLIPISLQRAYVTFFLPAVIHRWAGQDLPACDLNEDILAPYSPGVRFARGGPLRI